MPYRDATARAPASSSNDASSKPIENVRTAPDDSSAASAVERARVDAAREEHADRHVGDQVGAHRVAEARAALLDELGLVLVVACGQRPRPREPVER